MQVVVIFFVRGFGESLVLHVLSHTHANPLKYYSAVQIDRKPNLSWENADKHSFKIITYTAWKKAFGSPHTSVSFNLTD